MYLEHWELPMKPFESAPDVRFYYRSGAHEGALAKLVYAAENRVGGAMVWGPPGAGKTFMLELLRAELDPERFYPVSVTVAEPSSEALLYSLLAAMGETEITPVRDQLVAAGLLDRIGQWVEAVRDSGRHTVALVDEAHLLSDRQSLETARLILNTWGPERTLTVVFAGQEELASRVARFTPLDERIEVRAPVGSLEEDEACAYLLHRVEVAGGRRGIFTRSGAQELVRAAQCVPGTMNRYAEMCLVTAFAAGLDRVGPDVVAAVLDDIRSGMQSPADAGGALSARTEGLR
jgi:type II secretory pathway predicted ATPase ExeA